MRGFTKLEKEVFGRNLEARRKELGITQSALGAQMGISASALYAYEAGLAMPASRERFEMLAQFLETTAEALIGGAVSRIHIHRRSGSSNQKAPGRPQAEHRGAV